MEEEKVFVFADEFVVEVVFVVAGMLVRVWVEATREATVEFEFATGAFAVVLVAESVVVLAERPSHEALRAAAATACDDPTAA